MAAPVIFAEEHSPRDSKAFPGGQQSCDTAELQLSAPVTSQVPSWGGKSPTTPTQQVIFQCKSGLFCLYLHLSSLPLLSLFPLGKQQISERLQILHTNFSSKGETNSSMILVWVTPTSRG